MDKNYSSDKDEDKENRPPPPAPKSSPVSKGLNTCQSGACLMANMDQLLSRVQYEANQNGKNSWQK